MANELAVVPRNEVAYSPPALVPASIPEATTLAKMLSDSSLVPQHLRGKVADCFLVVEQSMRWGLSPFAVAQATSLIQGKLMFEGKLVSAVINAKADLVERLRFDYSGEGEQRMVTVRGTFRGEKEPREVEVKLKEARTNNEMWRRQPDQQLAYHGARVWARRHAPEIMLGIYAPEEMPPQTEYTPPAPKAQHHAISAKDPIPGASATPSSEVVAKAVDTGGQSYGGGQGGAEPPVAVPWYERKPEKMKRLQAAVGALGLGKAKVGGLKGKERETVLRDARIDYLNWATGRTDVTSTLSLHEDDADRVLSKAEAGEMPS